MSKTHQLDLFTSQSFNVTYEVKRQIRSVLSNTSLSRDQVVDRMNGIATAEGMRAGISKAVIDSWCKDSDPSRLPSLPWLVIFCRVMDTVAPIASMLRPLGSGVINGEDMRYLAWARAEVAKKKAFKTARLALEAIDGI